MEWATNIRRLRLSKGWKQTTLADMLSVDQATVSRWERGLQRPDLAARQRLTDLLRRELPSADRAVLMAVQASPWWALALDRGGRILAASEPMAEWWGQPAGQLAGRPAQPMISDDLAWGLDRAAEAGFWHGDVAAMRVTASMATPSGEPFHALFAWTPAFLSDGEVILCAQAREISAEEYRLASAQRRLTIVRMEQAAVG